MIRSLGSLYKECFNTIEQAREADATDNQRWQRLEKSEELFKQILSIETDERKQDLLRCQLKSIRDELQELENTLAVHPRADSTIRDAVNLENQGNIVESRRKYIEAVEIMLGDLKKPDTIKPQRDSWERKAKAAIDKIETMDLRSKKEPIHSRTPSDVVESKHSRSLSETSATSDLHPTSENDSYTTQELEVLKSSSIINGKTFVPWIDSDRKSSNYISRTMFVDPDGTLQLSEKQHSLLKEWKRGGSLLGNQPKMIVKVSPENITQELVGDCSFVSSLCIAAHYEQRFSKPLVSHLIFPQDKCGNPIINPCGKYAVRLWYNGAPRYVVVDDFLPISKSNHYLCSYSKSGSELWVSIIEKAYMKLNGGYDFPGSISSIDLYTLTGWIPESHRLDGPKFDAKGTWSKLLSAYAFGDVLMTCSTGALVAETEQRIGLVSLHAYAILEVREISDSIKLLRLKNPWNRYRWKGRFSPFDRSSWTPELCGHLEYDPSRAAVHDNGEFWIDFNSLMEHFQALHLSWNPKLFAESLVVHRLWPRDMGPKNDTINVGENPQYQLSVEVKPQDSSGIVWILLSRHITDKSQLLRRSESGDFLRLNIYDNHGRRVYYPEGPLIEGVFSNNPHFLVPLDLAPGTTKQFTLVVSLLEKSTQISYTLGVYASKHCVKPVLRELPLRMDFAESLEGGWDKESAGGCFKYPTFMNNPQWKIVLSCPCNLHVRLLAPVQFAVNIRLFAFDGKRVEYVDPSRKVGDSGAYRMGFCIMELDNLPANREYTLVVSTYDANQVGPFCLHVEASAHFEMSSIPREDDVLTHKLRFDEILHPGRVGARPFSFNEYPRFLIRADENCFVTFRVQEFVENPDASGVHWHGLNLTLCETVHGTEDDSEMLVSTEGGRFVAAPCGVAISEYRLLPGTTYCLVLRASVREECLLTLFVYSSRKLSLIERC